jgi:hypothetical protein
VFVCPTYPLTSILFVCQIFYVTKFSREVQIHYKNEVTLPNILINPTLSLVEAFFPRETKPW